MMATPEERTWLELQENLSRVRRQRGRLNTGGNKKSFHRKKPGQTRQEDHNHYRYGKHTPSLLPRLNHREAHSPPTYLRGSHYPVIPPLSADSDRSLDAYGLDISDDHQNNDSPMPPSPSPLPSYLLPLTYKKSFQNGHRHDRSGYANGHDAFPDVLRSESISRYSDLMYGVQYNTHRQQTAEHKQKQKKKQKYLVLSSRTPSVINSYPSTPDYDIWMNKKWDEPQSKELESSRRFAWRDPREENGELVAVEKQRKVLQMLMCLDDTTFASYFLDGFLQEFLEHELVLDVVCQVLVEERQKAKMPPRGLQPQKLILQQDKKARLKNQSMWLELVYRPDIYSDVVNKIVQESVREESALIVRECVVEMVDDYFYHRAIVNQKDAICDEVIQELLPDVAIESTVEVHEESLAFDIIDDETRNVVESFMEEAFATGTLRLPLTKQEQMDQKGEVEKLAYHMLIDSLCLDHLLQTIATNGQTWSEEEYLDIFLDGCLADILLKRYADVVSRRNITAHCIPLKRFHEKITTQVAMDVILQDLSDHLDEDMENLFEYEVSMDHSGEEEEEAVL